MTKSEGTSATYVNHVKAVKKQTNYIRAIKELTIFTVVVFALITVLYIGLLAL